MFMPSAVARCRLAEQMIRHELKFYLRFIRLTDSIALRDELVLSNLLVIALFVHVCMFACLQLFAHLFGISCHLMYAHPGPLRVLILNIFNAPLSSLGYGYSCIRIS